MDKKELYGISKTKYAIDNVFDIFNTAIDTFGDGVQVTDAFDMPGIGKDFYDIAKVYEEVQKEIGDLSPAEAKEIIDSYGKKAIEMFWTNDDTDYYGIENVKEIIDAINDGYVIIFTALENGIGLEDLKDLDDLADVIKRIIKASPEAKKELYDLNSAEIAFIGSDMASRVIVLLK